MTVLLALLAVVGLRTCRSENRIQLFQDVREGDGSAGCDGQSFGAAIRHKESFMSMI
jgi:hypothetical protein